MRPHDLHGPENGDPDDCDVEGGKWQITQAELYRREDKVSDQVDGERDRDSPRKLLMARAVKDIAKRDQDDRIKDLPNQSNRGWLGSPGRFVECVVPVSPSHVGKLVVRRVKCESLETASHEGSIAGVGVVEFAHR